MWPDRVSNPGPLTYESGALPIALRSPAAQFRYVMNVQKGNTILIQIIIAELCPLDWHTYFGPHHTVELLLSPHLLLLYLM